MVVQLRRELNILLDKEKRMWSKRSRALWLVEGDRNTRFFHGVATHCKRKNFINGIWDRHGAWITDEKAVGDIFVDFYAWLFTTSNPAKLERVLDGVQLVVDDSMNVASLQPFVWEEVEVAIK